MFGDSPFFGESIFHTPPAPAPSAYQPPPPPNYGGQYVHNANQSGFQPTGGSFSGYIAAPHQGLRFYDYGHPIN